MNNFKTIMGSMNNGLHNESTLGYTQIQIYQLCKEICPEKMHDILLQILPEEAFNKAHPNLNKINDMLLEDAKQIQTATMRK